MWRRGERGSEWGAGKQHTFGIGEVENIHTRMGSPIAADFSDMGTSVVENEWAIIVEREQEDTLSEDTPCTSDMGLPPGQWSLRNSTWWERYKPNSVFVLP
jgi:hypothetical protein